MAKMKRKSFNGALQALCRAYLRRLRYMARKHGVDVDGLISANKRGECEATLKEVEMLSRCVDDERLARKDVPRVIGKSYRQCTNDGTFERLKTLRHVGIYSKVSALLFKDKQMLKDG